MAFNFRSNLNWFCQKNGRKKPKAPVIRVLGFWVENIGVEPKYMVFFDLSKNFTEAFSLTVYSVFLAVYSPLLFDSLTLKGKNISSSVLVEFLAQ